MEEMDTALCFYSEIFYFDKFHPSHFFNSSRELLQGDPSSPFLLVIVMKTFSKMILKVEERGQLQASQWGKQMVGLSGFDTFLVMTP